MFTTKLQLVNHVLKTLKQDVVLTNEDLAPDSDNETGAFIAIELNKILDKALWVKNWRFASAVYNCTFLDETWERCLSVFELTGDTSDFHHIGNVFLEQEYEKKHTKYGIKPNLLTVIVQGKKFGTNWDVSDADDKNAVVFANVVKVPVIESWPSYFTEHIEKELEIPLFEKFTGLADVNRYKLTKQKSMEALEAARRADDGNDRTDTLLRIRRW